MRQTRITHGVALFALSGAIAFTAQAQDDDAPRSSSPSYCISEGAPKRVASCPKKFGTGKGGKVGAPKSRLVAAKRKVEAPKGFEAKGPSIQLDVATLRNKEKIKLRAETLLRREISITQRLIKNTRNNDPRRPDFLLRLAEGYFELVQVATSNVRKLDDPIHQACRVKKNKGRCNTLRRKQKNGIKTQTKVREQNIKTLAMLVRDHPGYKKMDEVLFSLGFSLEEMKQFDRARQVYHRLIKSYPQSSFIPNAYLSFAEYYFQQGDMRAAVQFYDKVTDIPPEKNRVFGYAVYKKAWCYYNLEDFKGALRSFVETVEFGTSNPRAHNVANLVRQARREMVMPYAQVGDPGRALEFFSRYAKDEEQAFKMFENLGELYFDTGQWPEVIAVYHKLMAEKSSEPKVCYWQTRVTNAVVSSKGKKDQVTEIERMIDLWHSYRDGKYPQDQKKTCKQAAASVLIDLATAWHREAIGTDTQPGTNDKKTMELASKLYRLILKSFPDMEQMSFPDIDKRDWPTEYKVSYYYAELLWKMESWGQCGPAFDKVLDIDPKGKYTNDAAYASVLCYNKQYQMSYAQRETRVEHRDKKKKKRRGKKAAEPTREELVAQYRAKEFTPLEEGMLNAYQRYVCYVPDSDDLAQIKYRRARIYYEGNHFEEASVLFKDIAFNHKDSELSVFAANLYLDALNVLGTYSEPSRPACYDEMNDTIEPLYELYCGSDSDREDHEDLCAVLEQLRCDLLRKKAEALQSNGEFKKAAQTYVSIFRKFRECGSLDEVLFNASINFEAARLLGRAIKVRKVLIDKYKDSQYSKKAIYLIGANFHALAMYDMAADYYEQFATKHSGELGKDCTEAERASGTCTNAMEALQNATFFRLGLGDEARAMEDAKSFEKFYRRKFPRETSQVKYSVGSIYERTQDWGKVIKHYSAYTKSYAKTAMPHELIQAHVIIGRAYIALAEANPKGAAANKKKAYPAFKKAAGKWQSSKDSFGSLPVSDGDKQRFVALAKIAAAEAIFGMAGEDFDSYASIGLPVFKAKAKAKGKAEQQKEMQEAFGKWMAEDFVKWLEMKKNALEKASASYEKISELQVPQWDIAAAARIGDMFLALVDQFRDAPVPPVLQGDDELVDIYYQSLDEASQPWVERAKNGYEFCLITATKVRWFNQWLTKCETELSKLDPRKYPRAAELVGSDVYTHSVMAVPALHELGSEQEGLEGEE